MFARAIYRTKTPLGFSGRVPVRRQFRSTPFRYSEADQAKAEQTTADQQQTTQQKTETDTKQQTPPENNTSQPQQTLAKEIAQLENEIKSYKEKYIMTMAELENTRKQTRLKVQLTNENQVFDFSKTLLDFKDRLDHFSETANLEADNPEAELKRLYNGVKETKKSIVKAFEAQEIIEDNPDGKEFDPRKHNAMFQIPYFEGVKPGFVGQVINSGYSIRSRVLRSANVGVFGNKPN